MVSYDMVAMFGSRGRVESSRDVERFFVQKAFYVNGVSVALWIVLNIFDFLVLYSDYK